MPAVCSEYNLLLSKKFNVNKKLLMSLYKVDPLIYKHPKPWLKCPNIAGVPTMEGRTICYKLKVLIGQTQQCPAIHLLEVHKHSLCIK